MRDVSVIACFEDSFGEITHIAKSVKFEIVPHDPQSIIDESTFELNFHSAQSLLDSLIDAGLVPSKKSNPSGEIKRLDAHLQDMRKLVFKD